jgi:hypothetical protein
MRPEQTKVLVDHARRALKDPRLASARQANLEEVVRVGEWVWKVAAKEALLERDQPRDLTPDEIADLQAKAIETLAEARRLLREPAAGASPTGTPPTK